MRPAHQRRILDLGCGKAKHPGAIGVDRLPPPATNADVVFDLNRFPYPFRDNAFDLVWSNQTLEHLDNLIGVMEELYRIVKPGGELLLIVPHFSSFLAYSDPTHRHFFSTHTLDCFIPGAPYYYEYYSTARFEKIAITLGLPGSGSPARRALKGLANHFADFYEQHLVYLFPVRAITFRLRPIK